MVHVPLAFRGGVCTGRVVYLAQDEGLLFGFGIGLRGRDERLSAEAIHRAVAYRHDRLLCRGDVRSLPVLEERLGLGTFATCRFCPGTHLSRLAGHIYGRVSDEGRRVLPQQEPHLVLGVCRHDPCNWHCPIPGRHRSHQGMSAGAMGLTVVRADAHEATRRSTRR